MDGKQFIHRRDPVLLDLHFSSTAIQLAFTSNLIFIPLFCSTCLSLCLAIRLELLTNYARFSHNGSKSCTCCSLLCSSGLACTLLDTAPMPHGDTAAFGLLFVWIWPLGDIPLPIRGQTLQTSPSNGFRFRSIFPPFVFHFLITRLNWFTC